MLIRSQCKTRLSNLKNIAEIVLMVKERGSYILIVPYRGTPCSIGKYSTADKAIKVMDDIECKCSLYSDLEVFTMPADEEVEL